MEKTKLIALIGSIGKRAATLTKDVQTAAVHCVLHAIAHGDVTLHDSLVEALGKQGRKASLRAWFELNGCAIVVGGTQKFSLDKSKRGTMAKQDQALLEAALMDKPWVDAIPEPKAISVLEIGALADKFLERLTKQATDAANAGVVVHGKNILDVMVEAVRVLHAKEYLAQKFDVIEEPELTGKALDDAIKAEEAKVA
jgi:hypothetical protein